MPDPSPQSQPLGTCKGPKNPCYEQTPRPHPQSAWCIDWHPLPAALPVSEEAGDPEVDRIRANLDRWLVTRHAGPSRADEMVYGSTDGRLLMDVRFLLERMEAAEAVCEAIRSYDDDKPGQNRRGVQMYGGDGRINRAYESWRSLRGGGA